MSEQALALGAYESPAVLDEGQGPMPEVAPLCVRLAVATVVVGIVVGIAIVGA